uniref:Uncharacterized protein n=1 Tax=Peromyscus maniculatus bairdii TaxID=230844 RepID=A0A8C8W5C0_PERMB
MAPNTMWSILSRLSSEAPSSDDTAMSVMLWGRKRKARRRSGNGAKFPGACRLFLHFRLRAEIRLCAPPPPGL